MFDDLDMTLGNLLRSELSPETVAQVSISFSPPDSKFPPSGVSLPSINLFLYEFEENRELRSTDSTFERDADGKVVRTPAPLRLDCRYLVTAWAKLETSEAEKTEHRLLGEVMRVLHRHREIPSEALHGGLKSQGLPVRAAVLRTGSHSQKNPHEFWQAIGGKPRAAFDYTVTISLDTREPEPVGNVVLSLSVEP